MTRFKYLLSFLLWGIFMAASAAIEPLEIEDKDAPIVLEEHVYYLVDSSAQYSFEQLRTNAVDSLFQPLQRAHVFHKHAHTDIWYKMHLKNSTDRPLRLIYGIDNSMISDVTFFGTSDSLLKHAGYDYPYHNKDVQHKAYYFQVTVAPGDTIPLILHVKAFSRARQFTLQLFTVETFAKHEQRESFLSGMTSIYVLTMLVAVFILWLIAKKRIFIFLALALFTTFLYALWSQGVIFHYICPDKPALNKFIGRGIFLGMNLSYLSIVYLILQQKPTKRAKRIYRLMLFSGIVFLMGQLVLVTYWWEWFYYIGFFIPAFAYLIWLSRKRLYYLNPYLKGVIIFSLILIVGTILLTVAPGANFLHLPVYNGAMVNLYALGLALVIMITITLHAYRNQKAVHLLNRDLEHKVEERTSELQERNYELIATEEELLAQQEELLSQTELLENQNVQLAHKQKEINESIRYAQRIQAAILPNIGGTSDDFTENFIFYQPRDVVSGDFYWHHQVGHKYFIAVGDCTGHSIPGAFMSIIGNDLLDSIIIRDKVHYPAQILTRMNNKIKVKLDGDNIYGVQDGMDIALVVIDAQAQTLEFAGAMRPLYIFNQDGFTEIKGDRLPVTSSATFANGVQYSAYTLPFTYGDSFYLFTDGFVDQFGGERNKKFMSKRLKSLLHEINPLPMAEQKIILEREFNKWKGNHEQVDDVLFWGLRNSFSVD